MHVLEKSPLLITQYNINQYNILLQKAIESEFQSIYNCLYCKVSMAVH